MSSRDEYRATYQRMGDLELLELAGEIDQLTPEARKALEAELGRRGITEEANQAQDAEAPPSSPSAASGLPNWFLGASPAPLPPSEFVAVFSAESESEAQQVRESLRAAGIESQSQIVILVPQAEAEKAFETLSEQLGPDPDAEEEDGST